MQSKSPLPTSWNVPQLFRDRLGEQAGRQRAMLADGHLLLVLHEPPTADHAHRGARLFWRAPDGTWQSNSLGPGPRSLRRHVEEFAAAVEKLEQLEEQTFRADAYHELLPQVTPLMRAAGHLHATLQEAREQVREDRDLIVCRDQAYAVHRAAELLNSDAHNGLQCAVARHAEEQAEISNQVALAGHRLNLMAAFFLPVATIASVCGMNLTTGYEDAHRPWPFVVAVAVGLVSGFLLSGSMQSRSPKETGRRDRQYHRP
jgi:hypothetical protein